MTPAMRQLGVRVKRMQARGLLDDFDLQVLRSAVRATSPGECMQLLDMIEDGAAPSQDPSRWVKPAMPRTMEQVKAEVEAERRGRH
ncbi:MAG: hypothetical protein AB7G13_28695 [Lautropia sp.]